MEKVAIIMGSISDKEIMEKAAEILKEMNISIFNILNEKPNIFQKTFCRVLKLVKGSKFLVSSMYGWL